MKEGESQGARDGASEEESEKEMEQCTLQWDRRSNKIFLEIPYFRGGHWLTMNSGGALFC